ncbi:YgjP-like metallopeptidase domain-containing protein [Bifidobacterium jacchi]|nr:YgjP-like metallopeptidase domain-containing protein [Bifidobacterium jacchi]
MREVDGLVLRITRKPIRNMYLRIKPPNGDIEISAPLRMSDQRIAEFTRERYDWIIRQRQRVIEARDRSLSALQAASATSATPESSQEGAAYLHQLAPADSSQSGQRAQSEQTGLSQPYLPQPQLQPSQPQPTRQQPQLPQPQRVAAEPIWTAERKAQAAAAINAALPALLERWTPVIGRAPTHVTLRLMSSRWGSCTPRTGRIRLNLQLGLMEPRFLEYVLVHEMTHLWAAGHGIEFQRRMDAYLPGWRRLRRELNRQVVL